MKRIPLYMELRHVEYSNEKAFTLIEVLIAFSVFSIIIFFMLPIFQITLNNKDTQVRLRTMEWEVFCSQIKKEMRFSSSAQVLSGRLILTKDTETVQFEKYGTNLRRRVNSTGNEIILQNVSQLSLTTLNNAVKITVVDLSGKVHTVTIFSLVDWNKGS
ncbi:competence type IV pilus minor pilin ComGF [Neobacillus sp. PS2-9]|uniref:competence type IV pilus minor pilin ComGF n=1 Tax=Neobacillus sp. PS2-9 TaxID=3070676 RepID=UPI0027E073A5|nr:competence type IV pilus minor pilin ComGF [Neobacillus sp. PS2-9]WML59757.1 competence type IV pilus minor pilin ComGF [Neobacillus sp. PS2-9]